MRSDPHLDAPLDAVGLLNEPVRRALYLYVSRQPEDVGRDAAAEALGVSRDLAAFHLDKLVAAGLLEAGYRRLSGRSGPGAGRPSKLYRRAPGELSVSLPQREYGLAARIFAKALNLGDRDADRTLIDQVAGELGESLGEEVKLAAGGRRSEARLRSALVEVLERHGYQPYLAPDGAVRLHNCPFHALAQEFREPVCGMNLALLTGVAKGAGLQGLTAERVPREGSCCVAFRPAA